MSKTTVELDAYVPAGFTARLVACDPAGIGRESIFEVVVPPGRRAVLVLQDADDDHHDGRPRKRYARRAPR